MKLDQQEFMGRTLTVAISAPPAPADTHASRLMPGNQIASLGGNRKPQGKNEQKSRISFIPASVQKAASHKESPPAETAPKTNADFRKLLLK